MSNGPHYDDSFRREIDGRVGRTLCQRYTLEAVIAVDATGALYRGAHRNGNRVAIKVLHTELAATKETRERFLHEARLANRVEHPGALRVVDDDTAEDGTVFFVTELLEGQTLEEMLLRQGGTLQASDLRPVLAELLDVLAAAHEKGVTHRALSPSCVFITSGRAVRIMDFGLARLADGSHIHARLGRAMEASGYVAPEQARGETAAVDTQADLWAAGAIAFRALAGRLVYQADTPEMVKIQAATQAAPGLLTLVPSCDPSLAGIIDRALAWKKEERWASAAAMAAALRSDGAGSVEPALIVASGAPASPAFAPAPAAFAPAPAAFSPAPPLPLAPVAQAPGYGQGYGQPFGFTPAAASEGGWIKWVAGAAALMMLLLLVGGGAAAFLFLRSSPRGTKPLVTDQGSAVWNDDESPVPVSSLDPVWGDREAPVTVVVFSEFQCPFCARVEPTLEQLKVAYGADKLRIVWKNQPLPFHTNAKPAAEAAEVVFTLGGAGAFFKFHDLAFQNQSRLTPERFREWARAAGVDGKAFDEALEANAGAGKVAEDQELAKRIGIKGTPGFRINGVELSGAQPLDRFKQVIDVELGKASAKLASGTPPARMYVVLSAENFRQPPAKMADKDDDKDPDTVWRVPVLGSPVLGKADAPITIVEFSDFQCPFCKRTQPTLDKVRETYGDKVRIVWKNEPLAFHKRAEPAAELALEARAQQGDAGFWRAHDALFASQARLDDEDLAKIGAQLHLDTAKVAAAIRERKYKAEIGADAGLADDVKATGTPHFFVNGRRLVGAQPFDKFQKVIDEELRRFESKRGSVAAKDYYASLMRDAKGADEPEKKRAPPVSSNAPFRGGKHASVVIQEWADFQCPFCARVEPTLEQILKQYGERVKIVWHDKPLPFHSHAHPAAELAREALAERGPDAFWKMHAKLFANQQKLDRDDLAFYAADLGLDKAKVAGALDQETHRAAIDADDKLATEIGITGTPAFLINDYYLAGAQPFAKFDKLIERALTEAR
jgi:protein-disulfide isomerase